MNTNNTNKANMIRTTNKYCDDHSSATVGISNYALVLTQAKNKMILVDSLDIIATGNSKGVTLDIKSIRNVMQLDAEKLCNGLLSLAGATNNATMEAAANYTFDKLKKLKKDVVDDVCEGIVTLANTNKLALVAHGIVNADITDTTTAISLYRTASPGTRATVVSIKEANKQITSILSDIVKNLYKKQLDRMTNTLKTSNTTYFDEYYSSREKIDLGKSKTKTTGKVTDKSGGAELYQASIVLTSSDGVNIYNITTGLHGDFDQQMKIGIYNGSCKKVGYEDFIITPYQLKLGVAFELNIAMTKI